jgi:hypothetical protein
MAMVMAGTGMQDLKRDQHRGAKAGMSARWPAGDEMRVLQGRRLAWPTGGEEEWRRREELEAGKECQMIMPRWAEKGKMDMQERRQRMRMQFQQNGHDGR